MQTTAKAGSFGCRTTASRLRSTGEPHRSAAPEGFIFDLVQIIDLDEDGDPDVVTLEEKGPYLARGYQGRELGVVWYENPAR